MQKGTFPLTTSSRVTYMRLVVLGFFFLCFSLLTGAEAECPLQLDPQRVVVRYGGSVEVNCSTSVSHKGMGWEKSEGTVHKNYTLSLITWRVSELKVLNINPTFCYINLNYTIGDSSQCKVELPVTVYKTPDSVSISTVNHTEPMIEGQQYELQCDVHDVAPVQNLTVRWYKNQTLLNQTTFSETDKNTPVNKTVTLLIRPDRDDIGAQYWCEAELDLGAEGPQPPPKNSSTPLSITVHYKPIINETKLPLVVRVFRGYQDVLVCEAEGNPKPTISWSLGTNGTEHKIYSEKLNITESTPENVSCTANNSVGTTTRHVKVSIQEDYLPLIAGLIAVIVVFIIFIFSFIYTVYYKKAKMGHYSLKNAKPSAQNGNIAQNGKQNPIPMKKLPQSSFLA